MSGPVPSQSPTESAVPSPGGRSAPRLSAHRIAHALGAPPPTAEQVAVIEGPLRSTLVVAGAGSGKTETMASRVLWLVANGLARPEEILGLTFTRKASMELATRLTDKLSQLRRAGVWQPEDGPDTLIPPTVSTYHAYAGKLVSEHGLRFGVEPDSRLLTEAASWQLAHEVVHAHRGPMPGLDLASSTVVHALMHLSGELAEHLVESREVAAWLADRADAVDALPGRDGRKPLKVGADTAATLRTKMLMLPLVEAYRTAKETRSALDFADQMAIAARLARDLPAVGASERSRYRVVLLDEFQDTSEAQMVLLTSLFAGSDVPVTAVGDPHQSIYGWRGASATTLSRFPRVFGDDEPTPVMPLSTSWRNSQAVLRLANATAAPLRERSRIDVRELVAAPHAAQGSVDAARLSTHVEEADHVARWVKERFHDPSGGWTGRSAAVLCRNRAQFDTVVAALRRHGLPVEVVGLGGLLNAPELLDLVSLLWAAQDPGRGDYVMRLLTGPVTRLGAADLEVMWSWARHLVEDHPDEEATLGEALDNPPPRRWTTQRGNALSEAAAGRLEQLSRAVRRVRAAVGVPLPDLVLEAERALGLDIEVAADPDLPDGWGDSWARAHLDALVDVAATFGATADRPTLGGFLDWLEAARDHERGLEDVEVPELAEVSVRSGAVQVLTVHAAKGLEWDVVAVPGLAEGVFPVLRGSAKQVDGAWSYSPHAVKGWLTGIAALPYPLRGDSDGLPSVPWHSVRSTHDLKDALEQVAEDGIAHRVEEERRLAYVAFTRARHEMLLTAPVWSTGKSPRLTSRFLEEALQATGTGTSADPPSLRRGVWADLPEDETVDNPLLAEQTTAAWPVLASPRRRHVAEVVQAVLESRRTTAGPPADPDPTDPRAEQARMLLAEREADRHRRASPVELPEHLSTSAVLSLVSDPDRYLRRLRRPLPTPPAPQAQVGTDFHAWVEQHYSAASLVDLDDLPGSADDPAADTIEALRATFLGSEWASRVPVDVEVAVETTIAGRVVRGRIDAVFPRAGGGFTVVDWKSGRPGTAEEQRVRSLQLAVYRVAYARLRRCALEDVDAAFYYASTGQTVRPALPTEGEVEATVGSLGQAGQRETGGGGASSSEPSSSETSSSAAASSSEPGADPSSPAPADGSAPSSGEPGAGPTVGPVRASSGMP
jgi:DNA helicase-2/ATP-dependent DNA helicase PcrA